MSYQGSARVHRPFTSWTDREGRPLRTDCFCGRSGGEAEHDHRQPRKYCRAPPTVGLNTAPETAGPNALESSGGSGSTSTGHDPSGTTIRLRRIRYGLRTPLGASRSIEPGRTTRSRPFPSGTPVDTAEEALDCPTPTSTIRCVGQPIHPRRTTWLVGPWMPAPKRSVGQHDYHRRSR